MPRAKRTTLMSPRSIRTQLPLAAGEVGLAGLLAAVTVALLTTAIMRYFDPTHVGLWVAPGVFALGVIDDPSRAREVLGNDVYLVALVFIVTTFPVCRELIVSARQRLRPANS